MKRLKYVKGKIDKVDQKILNALIENSRISNTDLARLVGLSAPSVNERIKRMEEAGVINGFTISVNPEAIGLPLSVWLRIKPVPGKHNRVTEILKKIPQIVECDRVTGEDCFIAKAHVESPIELEKMIDTIIPHAMTNTSLIQSSPVELRLPQFNFNR